MTTDGFGENLRAVRRRLRLSLREVSERSQGEFQPSVLGAYERGDRAISVARLVRLAELYGVPVDALLPSTRNDRPAIATVDRGDGIDLVQEEAREASVTVGTGTAIDVARLEALPDERLQIFRRYVRSLQRQRARGSTGRLSIRDGDFAILAAAHGRAAEEFVAMLREIRVLVEDTGVPVGAI